MCCNKEAVNGTCFGIFYSVRVWKKELYSSVLTPALCHFNGAVDI